jgi:hypothetical protein
MEDKALYEIMAPETDTKDNFVIDNDNSAEWALSVIKGEQADRDRLISICEQKIREYQEKIEQFKKQYESRTNYLKSQLNQYFQTVPHKATKTQETYKLPSGTLKLKHPGPEYQRDNDALLSWLESRNYTPYIEIKKTPKWAELKKLTAIDGDKVVDRDTGEVIEGVKVVEKPPEFEIDI